MSSLSPTTCRPGVLEALHPHHAPPSLETLAVGKLRTTTLPTWQTAATNGPSCALRHPTCRRTGRRRRTTLLPPPRNHIPPRRLPPPILITRQVVTNSSSSSSSNRLTRLSLLCPLPSILSRVVRLLFQRLKRISITMARRDRHP